MKNDTPKGFYALIVTYVTLLVFSVSFVNADVLIDIDLTDDELGELKSIPNTGTLGGTFEAEVDTPSVTEVDGIKALTLDGTNDWYVGPDSAPLTGDASRSLEAWVYNPEIANEETIVAWGRRGGGDGTNWSMLYGSNATWGALGGWGGAADMAFVAGQAGGPEAGKWHHLTLSYDKESNTRSIYVDGFLSNSENDGNPLNTWAVANDNETPLPIVIGNQNEANGTRTDALSGSLSIAKLKIHDTVLSSDDVFNSFDNDRTTFGLGGPIVTSFSSSSSSVVAGESTTLSWSILGADSISIDNGVGDVSGTTEISVSPTESTTYTLTAADADGVEQSASVDIKVAQPAPSTAVVIHQWKFDEEGGADTTLVDSVGGADGTIVDVGGNDGTVGGGSVTLAGGPKGESDYVKLPSGLISSLSSASIETWVTQKSAQNWSRVFSVGSSSSNVMHMSFTKGGNLNENEWRWNAQSNLTLGNFGGQPTNPIDEQVHWVVTVDDTGGADNKTKVTIYKNGEEVSTGDTDNDLSGLNDRDFFLGRSQWGDNAANASWEEFRIYNGALTAEQVTYNSAVGPDGDPPLPAVTAYFDFEGHEGNIVTDKGANGLDAEINRADQINIGGSGAPKGSTPGTGADFQGGFLNVAGADMTGVIDDVEGANSYTLSAWIKPSDLNGNKFLWGQTSQGIHNGIRNGGFLHQAHWGADTNGATNLNSLDGEWLHAAWVYDGDSDTGRMYLNGNLDYEGGKRAPNGSGNLIIGGSNGGGDNYRGMVDDIAFWNQALTGSQVQAIAGGQSPINLISLDEDDDGITDSLELALVGNTNDLGAGPGSRGVSFNSNMGNDVATMDADTVAGVVPSTGWVSTDGGADAQGGANGSITNGITIDWSSNGTWNTNNGGDNGDNKLMNGYIDAIGGDGSAQVKISGISSTFTDGYDLYVYFGSDGNGRTGKVALEGGATYSFNTFSAQGGDFPAQYTQTTDEADGNPQANYAVYKGLTGDVQTVDLIRGNMNSGFHGVQIVGTTTGDYDGDGLTDVAELEGTTSPIDADSDDDGLNDGQEIAAGTNPINPDSDNDGVSDGEEIVLGTDPANVDSDGDGFKDGDEVAKGSDPALADSIPPFPTPIAYYDFEGSSLDKSFNGNTANVSGNISFVEGGAPDGYSPGSAAKMEGGHFRVPGIDINSQIRDSGTGSYSMTAWIKPDSLQGERFIFGQTNQGIHNGIRNNAFLHQAHWGADTNGSTNLNSLGLLPLSSASNYPAGESPANAIDGNDGSKYLNFARTNTGIIVTPQSASTVASITLGTANDAVERDPASFILYGTNETIVSADNSTGDVETWTEIASGDLTLPDTRNTPGTVVNIENSTEYTSYKLIFPTVKGNGNSMQIAEIQFFSAADAGGDAILSSVDAVIAVHAPTPPEGADEDGWIHAAFVYDGATDTGSIYLNGVLDWEGGKRAQNGGGHLIIGGRNNGERNYTGLIDEVTVYTEALAAPEVAALATGGSPIVSLPDEDGDGFLDAWETKYAANLDILGGNKDASLLTYLNFDNQSNDQSGNGLNGTLSGPAAFSADAEGFSGAAGDYAINLGGINDKSAVIIENATLDSALNNNTMAVSFWQNTTQVGNTSSFWIHSPSAGSNERGFQAHVPWGNGTIYFDQSGCCGGGQRLTVGGKIIVNEWQHFVFQRDADGNQEIWVDGEKVAEALGTAEALEAFTKITIGAEGNNLNNSLAGRLDEFAVWNRKLTSEEILTLQSSATTEILNLTPSDADGDGLTDAEEYASQASDPTKADSDDDGLSDTQEIALGTQPLNADSDGDGLNDGAEGTAGTDPLNSDSDGDGYADGDEIKTGADPLDSDSTPPNLIAYFNFERSSGSSVSDLSAWGNDASVGRPDQTTLGVTGGAPNGPSPATAAQLQDGLLNVPGVDLSSVISGEGSYTFSAWIKPSDLGGDKFLFGQTREGIHNGIRGGGFLHQAHWGADTNGATNLNDYDASANDGWVHAAWTYDGATDTGSIYLDGVLDWTGGKRAPNGNGTLIIGGRNGGGNGYVGLVDEVAVWDIAAGAEYIAKLAAGQSPLDDNGDGLPDSWAAGFGVTDPDADADEDGIANADEFLLGTDPTNTDSDGDGTADGDEILGGFDPADSRSLPLPAAIAYYNFEGDSDSLVIDRTFNGNNATVGKAAQTTLGVEGGAPGGASPGKAADLQDGLLRTPIDATPIIQGDGSYTFTAWIKPSDLGGDKFLFGQTSQGIHNGIRNNGFLHQAHWGADTNGATNLNGYLADDEDGWVHAAWTYDAATDTGKIYLDGKLDWEGNKRAPQGSGQIIIGGRNGGEAGYRGLVDEIAIWDVALQAGNIANIADGQAPAASVDADGDGLPDAWENLYAGNLTDLAGDSLKSLGVSFNSNRDNANAAMDAQTVAGVIPSTGWLSTNGDADGPNGSISNGGLNIDWSSNGTWNTNNGSTNGDNKLMNGYIDAVGGDGASQVAISGLTSEFAEGYDLYVYFGSDGNNRTGKVQLVAPATSGLVITGVVDGDLSGGNPKAIVLSALDDIADLSAYGLGSANNGGGTDGIEFNLSGSVTAGQKIVVTTSANEDFFNNNFDEGSFQLAVNNSAPNVNGDDAVELFFGDQVVDVFGEIDVDGSGQAWEYKDGYAVRTGGDPGVFDVSNYSIDNGGLDTLDEAAHVTKLSTVFGFGNGVEDNDGQEGEVNEGTTYSYNTFSQQGGAFPEKYARTTDEGDGYPQANYAVFEGLSGDSQTINIIRGSNNSGFHGIQVVKQDLSDFDGDGLSDSAEFANLSSDPTKADSDDDGLSDPQEFQLGTLPLVADTDGDGIIDGAEATAGTDPTDSDSDDDGYADGTEIRAGSDPTDSNSVPPSLLAYFDFENEEGNVVKDKGAWGNDGIKDDGITYGGGPGTSGSNYPGAEAPAKAIDGDTSTKYLNFAKTNTGIIVTPQAASTVASISLTTANDDVRRDPASFVLYGTNEAIASADNGKGDGEAWTEIASGDLALSDDRAASAVVNIENSTEYASYKLIFPTVKDEATNSMQIADIQFFSAADAGGDAILSSVDAVLAVHAAPDVPAIAGAPSGNSPGTAADFSDDKINVPGVDLSSVISGEGSYTFAAWIKPSDLGGDKFIFGQTREGIHNGIRNNGFLHQAHWGADTNGATNLNDYDASANDGWVHAAFVYDGSADLGQIYLDGALDWEGGKRAPNGSGNLIVGGRNGGGAGYVGLIDDVAIWDVAKSASEIAYLANGGSPLIDITSDADGDGLTLGEEIEAGTDADNPDTDGDGITDGDEIAGGSNPLDANSRPGYYAQNFDGFEDGTTELGDGSLIAGAAARVLGERLQLTRDGEGLGFSSFSVPGLAGASKGFTATFDYELFDSEGSNNPADGFSFNFGDAELGELGGAEEGMVDPNNGSTLGGVTSNLSFEIDTWQNPDAEQGVNISGVVDAEDIGQLAFTNGVILEDGSRKTGSVEIRWDPSSGATFYTTGLTTNADFTNVPTSPSGFVGYDDFTFNLSARVGGANQDVFIDNLVIVAGKPKLPPLPAVTAYYDFEGQEGNTVADKGANGLDAEINRGDQLTIGGSGAPKGSTPGTGIDLQGGFLNVPGIDVSNIINDVEGQNSYTLSSWIKPSDLNGDKFLFGQTQQGIHNGIRGGGFLHQAHWGADNNGATNLSTLDGEWIHAAWTYDGAADVGKIYLNGVLDAEVSKRAPNGSGNLIIGGRNGGELGYRGMADDIAVWNEVLDARQIKALAGGQSPINAEPADDDEDGIPDGYEFALVGNTNDLGGDLVAAKSLGVSFNSNMGNDVATMDADTVAGVVPSTGWVSTDGGADAQGGANGSITNGITIDWSSNGTWNTNNGGDNGDNKLMNGYIDAIGGDGSAQVNISGINAEFADGYDLYVYFGSDGNGRTGKVALEGGATYSYNTFSAQGGDFPAQYTQTTDEADGNPQANYAVYKGLAGDTQTVNLIRGNMNSGFHGVQIVSEGSGDYDGDGLSDLAEYEGVTSPIVADGDEDGLNDGAEIAAGTNPNKADTDGDGLADGSEIEGGTDPTKTDTDDDGYADGAEIAKGSDPTDASSIPGLPAPIAFYNFEAKSSIALDRSFNDNTATASGTITFVDEGAPFGSSPSAAASMEGGHFRVPGIDMNSQIRDSGDGSYSMVAWIKPDSTDGERFIFGQTNQGIHNGIRNNAFLHQAHWGADTNGTTNLNDYLAADEDGWIHAAFVYDGAADIGRIYLDGVLDWEGGKRAPNGGGHLIIGGRNNGERPYTGLIDDVAIWNEALAGAEVADLAAGGSPISSLEDEDGDGFVDVWEFQYAGNLTDLGAGVYSQTFTGPDGSTDLEDGSVIFGAAASLQDNALRLTIDGQGLGFSSFSVPGIAGSSSGWTATFDYELFDSAGNNNPADGFSFNYGNAPLGDQGQAEEGMAGRPGVTENISFEVDTWQNFDAEQGVNISGVVGGVDAGQFAFNNGPILEDGSTKTGQMSLGWNPSTGADFVTTGLTTNADFAEVETGEFLASDDHNFIISARVGGANQTLIIDNLVIRVGESDFDEDGLSDLAEYNSGASDPTKSDSDDDGLTDGEELVAGTQPLIADSDGDGILDGAEGSIGTDPTNADSDGDGYADGIEVTVGSDPTDSNSTPPSLVAYYDFENEEGNVVKDKGLWGNNGDQNGAVSYIAGPGTSASNYPAGESPANAIDGNDGSKYLNFARTNTGIIVTPQSASTVASITLGTANDAVERDPASFILYGTNETIVSADNSTGDVETWTEIASGDLTLPDTRNTPGTVVNIENSTEYTSYKLIFPTVKGNGNSMQIAEIQFFSAADAGGDAILSSVDAVIAVHAAPDVPAFAGAPNGASPGTAADFQGGYLNVPGVDMSNVISGEGSYTFAAWIKPSDLGGNKFLFGQSSQGIHNGIRNGGFLHQAHWGADTNGATNLNDYDASANDGWVHAAWVYDGATDTGKIYLDGVEDYSGDKRAPNGSGNLIIGGSNGGGDNFRGLVDEIAVWDIAASADIIAALAGGASPLEVGGSDNPLRVTNFTYDKVTGELVIKWSTNPGSVYGLQYSTDLETWVDWQWAAGTPQEGQVIELEASGEDFTFTLNGETNPFGPQGANLPRIFIRAVEK